MRTLHDTFVAAGFDVHLHHPPARQSAPDNLVHVPNLICQDPRTLTDCRIRDKGPHTVLIQRLLGENWIQGVGPKANAKIGY